VVKRPVKKGKDSKKKEKAAKQFTLPPIQINVARPEFHAGSIFFPLPTGDAVFYKLQGTASQGDAVDHIEQSVPAKQVLVTNLLVKNWLDKYQKLRVHLECDSDLAELKGPSTVDVPALLERRYKLTFVAHSAGPVNGIVHFYNEETGEGMFYFVTFNVTRMDMVALPAMETAVRQRLPFFVPVENPSAQEVTFKEMKCSNPGVHIKLPLVVHAKSQSVLEFNFLPLIDHPQEKVDLIMTSDLLGEFCYTLDLTALEITSTERTLRMNTTLGCEISAPFRFKNFATSATTYECKLDSGRDFLVDSKINVPAAEPGSEGVDVVVDVRFEPSAMGDARDMLRISSKDGGKYTCSLKGFCEAPKPQGPILVQQNQFASIKFKNTFDELQSFTFAIDNPSFLLSIKDSTVKINKKAVMEVKIQYKPDDGSGNSKGKSSSSRKHKEEKHQETDAAHTDALELTKDANSRDSGLGKLIVSCPSVKSAIWVYYLHGGKPQ
jgi:hydrocephalus-inducing protein